MTSDQPIVLAACFNQRYVPQAATMLRSFAESVSTPARWYLVADDSVTDDEHARLVEFARSCGLKADAARISDDLVAGFDDCGYLPRIAWYRAVLAEAFPGEDRLIYLDSDLLVLHDIRPLWDAQLRPGDYFGAVGQPSYGDAAILAAGVGLSPDTPYFNSGVMLMDLALMRDEGFARRTREFAVSDDRPELPTADQCAMNALFFDRWTPVDPTWNCMSSIMLPFLFGASWGDDRFHDPVVLERAARAPGVVHFEGPGVLKPWNARCFNPFADLYRTYRATTPWPLSELEGRGHDALFARIPPRLQARLWQVRRWQTGLSRSTR
jgi:lipopolysaccharide biosynthesis glycosyltransferase